MQHHFLTQPLPGRFAPLLHRMHVNTNSKLCQYLSRAMCFGGVWIAEIIVPLASLWPVFLRSDTLGAGQGLPLPVGIAVIYAGLQVNIAFGGHFGFFNLMSALLSLALLNDVEIMWMIQCSRKWLCNLADITCSQLAMKPEVSSLEKSEAALVMSLLAFIFGILLIVCNVTALYNLFARSGLMAPAARHVPETWPQRCWQGATSIVGNFCLATHAVGAALGTCRHRCL